MKCRLLLCQSLVVCICTKAPRTLCPVRNLIVHVPPGRAGGLDTDMPLPPRQEVRNGNKNVTCGAPEVLDYVVLSPLISYSDLVDRVDVLDQL
jgi:hypothetical protein